MTEAITMKPTGGVEQIPELLSGGNHLSTSHRSNRHETSSNSSSCSSGPASGSSVPSTHDELGASDEVKVFKDEGDDELDNNGSEETELQEEKSSLIIESEQAKFLEPRHMQYYSSAFHGISPQTFALSPYLMPPYGYGTHLAGSPFHPIHSRSPIAPGVMGHFQSGFSSLAAAAAVAAYPTQYSCPPSPWVDHLAAWHHATSSLYHHASTPPVSPRLIGGPISTSQLKNGFKPASCHIPSGGTDIRSGISRPPASSPRRNGKSSQLQPKHNDGINKSDGFAPSSKSSNGLESSTREVHIKKPLNAFMLYMKETRAVVQAECTLKESAAINQILGRRWHALSREEQGKFYEKSRIERQKHLLMYPEWNARDSFRYGFKKTKKRSREKASDESGNMKRCRARYGMDEQDLWCKPCRRKKKCIRIQAYMARKEETQATSQEESHLTIAASRYQIPVSSTAQSSSSTKSESDYDDDGDVSSPGSLTIASGGPHSIDSIHSDQSVASPVLSGALACLGSPTTSATMEARGAFGDTWYRHHQQFKVPPTAMSYHHQMLINSSVLPHRIPVGTDPRDSKNPLSISQLTATGSSTRVT